MQAQAGSLQCSQPKKAAAKWYHIFQKNFFEGYFESQRKNAG